MGCSRSGDSLKYRLEEGLQNPLQVTLNREWQAQRRWHLSSKLGFFRGSQRTNHRSPAKLTYKRHILGMSTSPRNDSQRPKLFCLSCTPITSMPSKLPIFSHFGAWKKPCTEIWKFFTNVCMHTPIHVFCFKNSRHRCRISGRKAMMVS